MDCGLSDPWSRNPWGKRGSLRAHRWLEEQTVERADAVILNTPELLDEFSEWYGLEVAKKFHVVTNGYDPDILRPYSSQEPSHELPLVLTHAGALYAQRNPLPLLEALAKCIHDGRIPRGSVRLQLIGKSIGRFDIAGTIRRLDLGDTVVQIPPVSHATSLEMLAASHVLVAIQPGSAVQVPAKLYEVHRLTSSDSCSRGRRRRGASHSGGPLRGCCLAARRGRNCGRACRAVPAALHPAPARHRRQLYEPLRRTSSVRIAGTYRVTAHDRVMMLRLTAGLTRLAERLIASHFRQRDDR